MDGPIQPPDDAPLFAKPVFGTSHAAGVQAARKSRGRRAAILALLQQRPMTLFEVAQQLGVADHTISGRFTELNVDGEIEPTGDCRKHPRSGCLCEVWRVRNRNA